MSTPNFDRLSKLLSYKIFDPVSSGTEDGKKFYAIPRANYINQAYADLLLICDSIYHDKLEVFSKYYKIIDVGDLTTASLKYTLANGYKVISAYFSKTNGGDLIKIDYQEPTTFLDAKNETNAMNDPDSDNRKYTVVNGEVLFLPNENMYDVQLLVKNELGNFVQTDGDDIVLPRSFEPLLITLAAREAMADDGQFDKVKIYTELLNERKQLLGIQTDINRKKIKVDGGS